MSLHIIYTLEKIDSVYLCTASIIGKLFGKACHKGMNLKLTTEILSESTVIFYQIKYGMNAIIKSDEFNKIHCRSHNIVQHES